MSKWVKWGIALSAIWVTFLFIGHDDFFGLRAIDWWSYTDTIVLIAIWAIMWVFVRPRLLSSKRRSVMTSPKKPQAENLKPAIRKCLMCSQSFQSRDIGERICPDCKDSKTWRQGSWVDKRPRWSDPIPLWFNVLIIQTSSQSWQNFFEFEELENKSINYIV